MLRFLRESLVSPEPRAASTLDEWLDALRALAAERAPFELAVMGGRAADRLGYAFVAGYRAALGALVPDLPPARMVALCATESGGVHPRAIATTLTPNRAGAYVLRGEKTFVTLGDRADTLLVVASRGSGEDGTNRLAVVRVDARAPGVAITALPEMPFCPEVGHASLALDSVVVSPEQLLAGDGYDRYLKPFRTIEDAHVYASFLAYVLGVASHHRWPRSLRESLASVLSSLAAVAAADPTAPETHVALAGAIKLGRRLLDESAPLWAEVDADVRARWERDRPLLVVAEKARAKRIESAWRAFEGS